MKYLLSITTRVVTGKLSWGGGAIKCYWRTGPKLQPTAVSCANDHLLIIIEIHQKVQYIMLSSLDSNVQIDIIRTYNQQKVFERLSFLHIMHKWGDRMTKGQCFIGI